MHLRVVDTPDFFHDQTKNSEGHLKVCKAYCQPEQSVVLLVFQLGRFTDLEIGILEKLENKLELMIRDRTIVLLTHGDELKGSLEQYINRCPPLMEIIKSCSSYHLFNNKSKDTKQVIELIKKIPNSKNMFPKFAKRTTAPECLLC